jgi:recombinational DNA repair protein RecT
MTVLKILLTTLKNTKMEQLEKIGRAVGMKPEQVAIIKNTIAKGTSDMELSYFLMTAQAMGLNPFMKDVWCYKDNKGNLLIFAGRDGHLKSAQKDSRWNGIASSEVRENDTFELDIPNGIVIHKISPVNRGKIIGAYAICKPKGCDLSTVEWVEFETYNKGYNVWKSDPAAMIKKVAETHVLKKAFGLSGLNSEYDFEVNNGVAYAIDHEAKPDNSALAYVEKLINSSTYDHDTQAALLNKLSDISNSELEAMRKDLEANQLEGVDLPMYGQKEIQNKLNFIE